MRMAKRKSLFNKYRGQGIARLFSIALLSLLVCVSMTLATLFVHNVWDRFSNANLYVVLPWFWVITLISASFLDCFNFSGKRYYNLLYSIYISALISNITLLALPYVAIGAQLSKKIALLNFVLELAVLPFWLTLSRKFYFRCRPPLPSVLITDDPEGEAFMLEKVNRYSEKYRVDAITSPNDREIESIILSHKAVILGKLGTIDKAMFLRMCASMEKPMLIRPDYTDIMLSTSQSEQFDDLMMISVNKFGLTGGQRVTKRILDLCLGLAALVPALPVILLCALLIFLQDGHSPFFMQKRLTRGGREYGVYKLRTMIPDAEKHVGPVLAEKDDPRITKIGRILRSLRLDELPQIFNIIKGDMSIVGPRPERQFFYDEYTKTIPEFSHRLAVKAGLTGMAQVWGRYSTDPYEKLMLDLLYIQSYSLMLDIKLMIETVRVLFVKESSEGVDAGENAPHPKGEKR